MYKLLFAGLLLFTSNALAQTARVTVSISNTKVNGGVNIYNNAVGYDPVNRGATAIPLDARQSGSAMVNISGPQSVIITFVYNKGNSYFSRMLYLSPGDDLNFKMDFSKQGGAITITGKGSNNNQTMLAGLTNIDLQKFREDDQPGRAIAAINKQDYINKILLNKYIALYHPTANFIQSSKWNQVYFAALSFYEFKQDSRFGQYVSDLTQYPRWQQIQDSLFATIKLNNDAALSSYNYTRLLSNFLLREKEHLWDEEQEQPKQFYKKWYHTSPAAGKALFEDERKSLLLERIINKHFTGKTAEYMYTELLKMNLYESYTHNMAVIFNRFKQKYPKSKYTAGLSQPIAVIVKKEQQTLTPEMKFVANNGSKLNTMQQLLALTKGKVALVDMWGTWCSPCREEIDANSSILHNYFKGKNVEFVYIANFDTDHEKEWKKLIAYYHMEGTHILANAKLNKDMMGRVKGSGYPTYIIINKDGSYAQAKTKYPVNRQALIEELEDALAM